VTAFNLYLMVFFNRIPNEVDFKTHFSIIYGLDPLIWDPLLFLTGKIYFKM
jgi:hypothetical protein